MRRYHGLILGIGIVFLVMTGLSSLRASSVIEHGGVNRDVTPTICTPEPSTSPTQLPTNTPPETPTPPDTATPDATDTPEPTASPTNTGEPTETPSNTATPTWTPVEEPSSTPTQWHTPTATPPQPTATNTIAFTATPSPPPDTPTQQPTGTPTPPMTATPTAVEPTTTETPETPTSTPEPTHTVTPGASNTPWPTTTPVFTWTPTLPTNTPGTSSTSTPTPDGSGGPTPEFTETPQPPTPTPPVSIEFLDSNGQELDNIHRIGISNQYNNRSQELKIVVSPVALQNEVQVTKSPRLNVTVLWRDNGIITISAVGTLPSESKGDEWICATVQGYQFYQHVSVVVPGGIGTPHPQPCGQVECEWILIDYSTSPRYGGQIPIPPSPTPGPTPPPPTPTAEPQVYMMGCALWAHWLWIDVTDQFGDPIEDIYDDSMIEEFVNNSWLPINQKMLDGQYKDPVGPQGDTSFILYPSQQAENFVNKTPIPIPFTYTKNQQYIIRVDYTFVIDPAITGRVVSCTQGTYNVCIVWPD